jgi:outer membrane receptor protein involved in Fe transport
VLSYFPLGLLLSISAAGGPATMSGVVLDSAGHALPRAEVRVVANGSAISSTFTDPDGRFSVPATTAEPCRIEATLAGFASASMPCAVDEPVRLTLAIAPLAEHIVVSATRTEAPAGQLAAAVTVFDHADIERRQQPPLADLLRAAPGVHVVRSGAPGAVTSLFVRGGESNYTKVLLDGVPLNEPGGAIDLSNLSTWNLDRVELVSGANSALFGSDAMTGVVQLFTARADAGRPVVRLAAEGGGFGTARGSAGISGRAGVLDYSADVARISTDNEVPNSAFANTTVSASAGVQVSRGATLRIVGRLERSRAGVPGQSAFGRPDLDARFARTDGVWGTTYAQTIGRWREHASYGLTVSHQASTNLRLDPP